MPAPGPALDDHFVPRRRQLADACRHEADSIFVDLDLARNADSHRPFSGSG